MASPFYSMHFIDVLIWYVLLNPLSVLLYGHIDYKMDIKRVHRGVTVEYFNWSKVGRWALT